MSSITQLRIWNDPGFTENCIEVPKKGATLPSPSLTLVGPFNPSKDRLFGSVRIKEDYLTLMNATYVEVTYDMNNSADIVFYGWVDSVVLESDTEGFPMTVINWHIDYWRTYISKAEFGSGMVIRRQYSESLMYPPQNYPYRWLEYVSNTTLPSSGWWVYLYIVTTASEVTTQSWWVFPVSVTTPSVAYSLQTPGNIAVQCPTFYDVVNGLVDERFGVDPSAIAGMFLCPVPPAPASFGTYVTVNGWSGYGTPDSTGQSFEPNSGRFSNGGTGFRPAVTESYPQNGTTDTNIVRITGFDGETIATLPWGLEFDTVQVRVVASSSALNMEYRFYLGTLDEMETATEGMTVTIPAMTVDMSTNAWSSYVYSGARQVEIDQRRLQIESQAVSGGISAGTSALSGAVTGALIGASAGPVGALGGAAIGALASAGTNLLSTGASYLYQSGAYSDEMQRISDYQASNQTNSLLMYGTGYDIINNGIQQPRVVTLTCDEYSLTQRENDLNLYGATVSEPTESCQSLVDAGGPLQIQNLVVTGDIPVEAKQYFRTRLSKGVRMI